MRKISRKRNKKHKILIIIFLVLSVVLSVGYAAFGTDLSFKAKGNIKSLDNVRPTFEEVYVNGHIEKIVINYPSGCIGKYTCSFIKNGHEVIVRGNKAQVNYEKMELVANVSNGNKIISNTKVISSRASSIICHEDSACSVVSNDETIDWEKSNSYIFNTLFDYPFVMKDDLDAMKNDLEILDESQITTEARNLLNSNYEFSISFALYDFDLLEKNEYGLYEISLYVPYDYVYNANLNLLYYDIDKSLITLGEIVMVDSNSKFISFECNLPSNTENIIMFLIGN